MRFAQERRHDVAAAHHVVGGAFGDDLPVIEHDDAVGRAPMTARITCSTNTIVAPSSRILRISPIAPSISVGVRPDSTSSSSSSRGRDASARASSRNFRW